MKKKVYMALMMAAVISLAGCGKKTTTTEAQATPEPTEAAVATEEPEQEETQTEEVTSGTDDTGVYYGSTGITELNVGTDAFNAKCTIKVPLNYIIGGAAYIQDGSEQEISDLGGNVTVEEGMKKGELSKVATDTFVITSLDAKPTDVSVAIYDTANVGSYEDLKQSFSDGKDVGTTDNPVWMYDAPESSYDPNADFVILMPVSDDTVLTVYYSGPLTDEIGKEAAAQKVSNLVTKK